MVRRDEKEKKSVEDRLYNEVSNRGRTRKKRYQGRGKSQGRSDLSDKECYYCKKKLHIHMICNGMKEDLKRVRNSRGGRRIISDDSRDVVRGFVGNNDDDYDGAQLVDGEVVYNKE